LWGFIAHISKLAAILRKLKINMKIYSDQDLMKIAIEEHLKCTDFPRVGAVIAKTGIILSTGFRGEEKGTHAERVAIKKLTSEELEGSTLYTTLEPCIQVLENQQIESCADLIVKSGITKF
jgi:diaminohydroxyphosphoribosylaminopyrimidine deaminase/5-amino-6-(5-phosphoribosylamino)uracil reductase